MIKIAIVDDHEIFLKGLERLFNTEENIEVIASFDNGESLLREVHDLDVDVLLLDIQLPLFQPEELLIEIRKLRPQLPILYLTMIRGTRVFRKLEKHQIQGYILKDAAVEELKKAIEMVARGETYFSLDHHFEEVGSGSNTVTTPANKLAELLSPREYEILKMVCQEYSSAEIGEKLFLSKGTVDTHRRNILVKLGVNNTVGMVKFALQNGILHEED
ncbi:response regulator transcription factor [Jiulongibacter sp. NS-SX5]|uniref:response regulator transcription factor n=1 Tax=Jiulongibacter sp. NS-SX5 TaxID=3463854 RepID=UPI004059F95A